MRRAPGAPRHGRGSYQYIPSSFGGDEETRFIFGVSRGNREAAGRTTKQGFLGRTSDGVRGDFDKSSHRISGSPEWWKPEDIDLGSGGRVWWTGMLDDPAVVDRDKPGVESERDKDCNSLS